MSYKQLTLQMILDQLDFKEEKSWITKRLKNYNR